MLGSQLFYLALRQLWYIMLCSHCFFLPDVVTYMVSNLSFLLQVSPVSGGQSVGDEPGPMDKGKVIR